MKIIFEDHEKTPSSKLLARTCGDVIFSRSNAKIRSKVRPILKNNSNEVIIIYFDLVPDNYRVIDEYNKLVEYYALFSNIIIIPIVCIEYYLLLLLNKLNMFCFNKDINDVLDVVSRHLKWEDYLRDIFSKCTNFEKVCKEFFEGESALLPACLVNSSTGVGDFYFKDCVVCGKVISIEDKSRLLWTLLPVFPTQDKKFLDNYNIKTERLSLNKMNDIQNRVKSFYKLWFKEYNLEFQELYILK